MTNNKKLTVVEWLQETLRHNSVNIFKGSIEEQAKNLEQVFQQAKEMENQQSQLYATFCLGCINKNLPVIKFEDWIKL